MKILSHIHAYPPSHNAGAEWMQHSIMKWLVEQGHECHVLIPDSEDYYLDGVHVYPDTFENCNREWNWCDVGFTHLNRAGKAWNWAQETHKPIIYSVHNTFTNRLVEVKVNFNLLYNTEWAFKDCQKNGYKHNGMILHPPVFFDDYHTSTTKKYIALINCWERKGGKTLIALAKAMPETEFLGVKGGYGEQEFADLPNMTYVENTPDIKSIYAQTRILLMPSVYESYGRTAVEAMCSGIPVIATDTPGLRESLGKCGTFIKKHDDIEGFKTAIESFTEDKYKKVSICSIARAKDLNEKSTSELHELIRFIKKLTK